MKNEELEAYKKREKAINNINNVIVCHRKKLSEEEIESLKMGIKALENMQWLGKQLGYY